METLIRRAVTLSWFTIAYNLVEGGVAIGFGLSDDSIALAGFGVDSLIEVASAALILWRFQEKGLTLDRERKATMAIGGLFILLAAVTVAGAGLQLSRGGHPETTLPGLIVSAVSLSFMFYLWRAKKTVGEALSSPAVLQDAACSLACIRLSFVLFTGSLLYLALPSLWWIDSVAAIVIAAFIGKEGFDAIRAARSEEFEGGCCG